MSTTNADRRLSFPNIVGHLLATTAVVLTVDQLPAFASHGQIPKADNSDHSLEKHSLTTNGSKAFNHGVSELARFLNAHETTEGDADVEVYDSAYGNTGWHGTSECVDFVISSGGTRCDDFTVKFNTSTMANDEGQWKSLGCHEFGHTVGLGHRSASNDADDNSCMRSDIWPTSFDSHDDNQISS